MKKWKRYIPLGMLAIVVLIAGMVAITAQAVETKDGMIPYRVYFGEIDGGGKAKEDVIQEIEAYVESLKDTKIVLSAGSNTVETTVAELGVTWGNPEVVDEAERLGKSGNLIKRYKDMKDLENEDKVYDIAFDVDEEKVKQLLEANADVLNTEAKNAGLQREDDTFVVVPGVQGVTVNVSESVAAVEEYFVNLWNGEAAQIELTAEVVEPKGTAEELSKVQDLLGSYSTNFGSSVSGRVTNIKNGASKINGIVLYPGEQLSVSEKVVPFSAANGYALGGAYENGKTVQSYGGGICQVSTTLYNAAIRAELEIVERYAHSMLVGYVSPSADAAIAEGYKDLKLRNNTNAPIYIEGYTSGGVLHFNIYGEETRDANREVSFVSEVTSSTPAGKEFVPVDAPIGFIKEAESAHTGMVARLWKIVTVDGVEVSREVFNESTYRASAAVYEIGIASIYPDAVANMSAALATQDEATIQMAIATWNDAAVAARQQQAQVPVTSEPTPSPEPTPEQSATPAGN